MLPSFILAELRLAILKLIEPLKLIVLKVKPMLQTYAGRLACRGRLLANYEFPNRSAPLQIGSAEPLLVPSMKSFGIERSVGFLKGKKVRSSIIFECDKLN